MDIQTTTVAVQTWSILGAYDCSGNDAKGKAGAAEGIPRQGVGGKPEHSGQGRPNKISDKISKQI